MLEGLLVVAVEVAWNLALLNFASVVFTRAVIILRCCFLAVEQLLLKLRSEGLLVKCESLLLGQTIMLLCAVLLLAVRVFVVAHHKQLALESCFLVSVQVGVRPLVAAAGRVLQSGVQLALLCHCRLPSGKQFLLHLIAKGVFEFWQRHMDHLTGTFAALCDLLGIELHVGFLELAHLFDFVEINDEAGLRVVDVLDALAAKDGRMLRTVEVLDSLVVLLAQVRGNLFVLALVQLASQTLIVGHRGEEWVLSDHLIENVEVEWQFVN